MKRILIIGLALVVLALVVGFVLSQDRTTTPPLLETPTQVVDAPPRTIEFPELPPGARFVYAGDPVSFPPTASVYHVTPAVSSRGEVEARALDLASRFGFTASPSAFWRSGIFAAAWNTEPASLSVSFSKDIFSFSLSQRRITPQALRITSATSAPQLVSPLLSLPTGATLVVGESEESSFDGVVVLDAPDFALIQYPMKLVVVGTPVLTREYSETWARVIVDSSGVVRVLSAALPFRSLVPVGEVPLISIADAVANLNAGRGAVLWVTDASAPPGYGSTPFITNAQIETVELVYVIDGETLRPAYLFVGTGEERGSVQEFSAFVFASSL